MTYYFGPHREPAVLVDDPGELNKPGVFYYTPCKTCGGTHRFLSLAASEADGPKRCWMAGHQAYEMTPAASCTPGRFGGHSYTCACSVFDRRIFAVIDEPPSKAETRTRGRKLENA